MCAMLRMPRMCVSVSVVLRYSTGMTHEIYSKPICARIIRLKLAWIANASNECCNQQNSNRIECNYTNIRNTSIQPTKNNRKFFFYIFGVFKNQINCNINYVIRQWPDHKYWSWIKWKIEHDRKKKTESLLCQWCSRWPLILTNLKIE